jgi:hypothetical protein
MSRTSIVLFSVVLSLAAFIAFFERGTLSTGEREGRKGRILDSFVRDRVTRIELQRKGVTTVLTKVPANLDDQFDVGGWRVDQPYSAKADQNSVDNLLGALEYFEARRSLGDLSPKEREAFGLTHPRYRVAFVVGRERVAFSIGGSAADGGAYLALQNPPRAYVVGKDVVEALDHDAADFHSKELHQGASIHTLVRLGLLDASGPRSVEKRDGFFWLTTPFQSLVAEPALRGVIDGLDGLRASRYVAPASSDLAPYGLATPGFTLTLVSRVYDVKVKNKTHEEKLELQLGGACAGHAGESYLRVDGGAIFCALDSDLAKLKARATELRETRLLPLEDAEIHGVQIVSGASELVLTESGNDVLYRASQHGHETGKGIADRAALSDWYKALRSTTISDFSPPTAADSQARAASPVEVTFKQGKDQPSYTLRLLASDQADALATRLSESTLLHLPLGARDLLSTSAVRFRKRQLIDEDETHFTQFVVTRSDGVTETVHKTAGAYELSGPCAGVAQRSSVEELLRLTSKLAAVRFVTDSAKPEHGFNPPYRVLRIEYKRGESVATHRLELGAALGDEGRFARLDGDPAVFLVANPIAQKLDAPLLSRDTLALPLDHLASFELSAAHASVHVERRGETFAIVGGAADTARAERLARVLATLHAAAVAGYGKPSSAAGFDKPELRVGARLSDGQEVSLLFGGAVPGGADSPQVFVRRSGVDATFQVPRSVVDALLGREPAKSAG